MLQLREGVRINGLKPEALLGMIIVERVFSHYDAVMVVVSVADGDHDGGEFSTSAHYGGYAFDVLQPSSTVGATEAFEKELQDALGVEFHVVAHKTKTHIHVAFIPQRN